jgi:hypothetical protein
VKRILMMLTVALVLAAVVVASAMPVLAAGGATQTTCFFSGQLGNDVRCNYTTTPSGNINGNFHYNDPL